MKDIIDDAIEHEATFKNRFKVGLGYFKKELKKFSRMSLITPIKDQANFRSQFLVKLAVMTTKNLNTMQLNSTEQKFQI